MLNFNAAPIDPAQARFFFIFSPNNSGTTVLSQYLAAQLGGYLPEFGNNEGQNDPLVAGMMRHNRWNPDHDFDWGFIRTKWETRARGKVFVEGSPPSLMRFHAIAETFGADSSALSSICSPYQQIASCLRRYKIPPFSPVDLVSRWVIKARQIQAFRETYPHFPALTYQGFTAHPQHLNVLLDVPAVETQVAGKKGSDARGIVDQSAAAILFMTEQEIDQISSALLAETDLMANLGFEIMSGADLRAQCSEDASALALADKRREAWNEGRKGGSLFRRLFYELRVRARR
jgi:hypothetical protein